MSFNDLSPLESSGEVGEGFLSALPWVRLVLNGLSLEEANSRESNGMPGNGAVSLALSLELGREFQRGTDELARSVCSHLGAPQPPPAGFQGSGKTGFRREGGRGEGKVCVLVLRRPLPPHGAGLGLAPRSQHERSVPPSGSPQRGFVPVPLPGPPRAGDGWEMRGMLRFYSLAQPPAGPGLKQPAGASLDR